MAMKPAAAVTRPPKRKRIAYSCGLVVLREARLISTIICIPGARLPETELPEAEGDSEPHGKECERDSECGWFVAQEDPAGDCCVDGHGDGSGDHGARL